MIRSSRLNITLPQDWRQAFQAAAKKDGVPLSDWLRQCGAANLPKSVQQKLSEPAKPGRR